MITKDNAIQGRDTSGFHKSKIGAGLGLHDLTLQYYPINQSSEYSIYIYHFIHIQKRLNKLSNLKIDFLNTSSLYYLSVNSITEKSNIYECNERRSYHQNLFQKSLIDASVYKCGTMKSFDVISSRHNQISYYLCEQTEC